MNIFNFLTVISGLFAIGSFFFGTRVVAQNGAMQERAERGWHGAFSFFVYLTILVAPLSH